MSRNRGGLFGGGSSVMDRGNALSSGARPMTAQIVGKKQEQRERTVINAETRAGVFGWKEIIFHNKMVREESKKTAVRRLWAHQEGRNADNTPKFSSTQLRYNRGVVRAIYQPALVLGAAILAYNVWPDSGSTSATTDTVASTGFSTETSLPSVLVDPGTETTTTTATTVAPIASVVQVTAIAPNIFPGASGANVEELQRELRTIGCDIGTDGVNHDGIDGHFGPHTTQGLIDFQTHAQLAIDGQYGPASQADLSAALTAGDKTCGVGF